MSAGRMTDFWFTVAMDQAGISLSELARLIERVPALASETEKIKRQIPLGQAQAWAFLSAIQNAQRVADGHGAPDDRP